MNMQWIYIIAAGVELAIFLALVVATLIWTVPEILKWRRERCIRRLSPGGVYPWKTGKDNICFEVPRGRTADPVGTQVLVVALCAVCGEELLRKHKGQDMYYCPNCAVPVLSHLHPDEVLEAANEVYRHKVCRMLRGCQVYVNPEEEDGDDE